MTERSWHWKPARPEGIWRHGAGWARPIVAAAPWIAIVMLLVMFWMIGNRLAAAPGVMFDLPASVGGQGVAPALTMLAMPNANSDESDSTLVFFDDARYEIGDPQSAAQLGGQIMRHVQGNAPAATLLLLADKRVPTGDLLRLVGLARGAGIGHVQIAEKRE